VISKFNINNQKNQSQTNPSKS